MKLDDVVPWGRSRLEYESMFALKPSDRALRILGCADGPASFNAEWTRDGGTVLSIDPLYSFRGSEIRRRFEDSVDDVMSQVDATPENWTWSFHRDSADLLATRRTVLDQFLADYEEGLEAGRYRLGELPALELDDDAFDLALCSHFLFLYSDHFSRRFHVESALELCRVAREVRIFPLLSLSLDASSHVDPVRRELQAVGVESRNRDGRLRAPARRQPDASVVSGSIGRSSRARSKVGGRRADGDARPSSESLDQRAVNLRSVEPGRSPACAEPGSSRRRRPGGTRPIRCGAPP